ncbi:MAG: histidine kinase [Tidjanibacter sp.]|nr:histidine kinase [Tidjanibacter sp.]
MNKELRRLIAVIVAILLLRIGLVNIYDHFVARGGIDIFDALSLILFDPLNLPITLSLSLVLGYLVHRSHWLSQRLVFKFVAWVAIVSLCSLIATFLGTSKGGYEAWSVEWHSVAFTGVIFYTIVLVALYLWLWFRSSRRSVSEYRAKSERSQYRYTQLKRQLNPHFLFNSLSILDYLVQEQLTERASDYIKKLANIYRYLLKQEEYDTIELSKEVDFLGLYVDIMRERFLDGFDVTINLSEADLSRKTVPCSLQVLVENAFKHNAVSPTNKLHIEIRGEEGWVVVSNNLNPKQTPSESNGFGLKNLRARYDVLTGKKIKVESDKQSFTVKIPLL